MYTCDDLPDNTWGYLITEADVEAASGSGTQIVTNIAQRFGVHPVTIWDYVYDPARDGSEPNLRAGDVIPVDNPPPLNYIDPCSPEVQLTQIDVEGLFETQNLISQLLLIASLMQQEDINEPELVNFDEWLTTEQRLELENVLRQIIGMAVECSVTLEFEEDVERVILTPIGRSLYDIRDDDRLSHNPSFYLTLALDYLTIVLDVDNLTEMDSVTRLSNIRELIELYNTRVASEIDAPCNPGFIDTLAANELIAEMQQIADADQLYIDEYDSTLQGVEEVKAMVARWALNKGVDVRLLQTMQEQISLMQPILVGVWVENIIDGFENYRSIMQTRHDLLETLETMFNENYVAGLSEEEQASYRHLQLVLRRFDDWGVPHSCTLNFDTAIDFDGVEACAMQSLELLWERADNGDVEAIQLRQTITSQITATEVVRASRLPGMAGFWGSLQAANDPINSATEAFWRINVSSHEELVDFLTTEGQVVIFLASFLPVIGQIIDGIDIIISLARGDILGVAINFIPFDDLFRPILRGADDLIAAMRHFSSELLDQVVNGKTIRQWLEWLGQKADDGWNNFKRAMGWWDDELVFLGPNSLPGTDINLMVGPPNNNQGIWDIIQRQFRIPRSDIDLLIEIEIDPEVFRNLVISHHINWRTVVLYSKDYGAQGLTNLNRLLNLEGINLDYARRLVDIEERTPFIEDFFTVLDNSNVNEDILVEKLKAIADEVNIRGDSGDITEIEVAEWQIREGSEDIEFETRGDVFNATRGEVFQIKRISSRNYMNVEEHMTEAFVQISGLRNSGEDAAEYTRSVFIHVVNPDNPVYDYSVSELQSLIHAARSRFVRENPSDELLVNYIYITGERTNVFYSSAQHIRTVENVLQG